MDRFTDKKGTKKDRVSSVKAYKQLAQYEDIGFTPSEIVEILGKQPEELLPMKAPAKLKCSHDMPHYRREFPDGLKKAVHDA